MPEFVPLVDIDWESIAPPLPPVWGTCNYCATPFMTRTEWSGHSTECGDCGERDCPQVFEQGEHYCEQSDDEQDGEYGTGTGVHNYSYTPRLQFRGEGDYHLGVELEISTVGDASAHPIYSWAQSHGYGSLFYVKEDGSVDGFEIVTHPMTPSFFESVDWDGFFAMLNETYPRHRNRREPEGHGMHVHVSRTAFPNRLALARWTYLLHAGRPDMERIARRTASSWARFSRTPVSDVIATNPPAYAQTPHIEHPHGSWEYVDRYCMCGCGQYLQQREFQLLPVPPRVWGRRGSGPNYPPRYSAVNLINPDTVEVRLFRSTRSPDDFRDAVRTLVASVDYIRANVQPCHATGGGTRALLAWASFTEYVREQFAHLYPTVAGMEVTAETAGNAFTLTTLAPQAI